MTEYFGSRKTIKRPYGHREEEEDEPAQRGNESYSKNCDDGSESNEEVPQKKVAKKAASSSSSRSNESGENGIFDIGGKRKINVKEFRGKVYVDIREYYEKDGELLPGKKGISLTIEQWEKLKALIPKIDDAIAAKDN